MLFKSARKRSRYAEDVDSDRKSLEEKSTAVRGKTVSLRRADLASRRDNAADSESTRVLGEAVLNALDALDALDVPGWVAAIVSTFMFTDVNSPDDLDCVPEVIRELFTNYPLYF